MSSATAALSGTTPAAPAATPVEPAAPASTPAATPSAPAAAPANDAWYSGIQDETLRGWVQNKGWKDATEAVKSGYNLEKLIGFEKAGRTIVLPKDDATPEERRAFLSKLGVPEKAADYKIPVPEGQSGEFANKAAEWFHEAGLTPKQAEQLATKWNEHMTSMGSQNVQMTQQAQQRELDEVYAEWGAAKDKNIDLARRATMQFLPTQDAKERQEMLGKIENAIGTKNMLKLFAEVGKGLGEHAVHQGNVSDPGAMTPAQAKARIEVLKSDREWSTKYINGDATARAEMERLSKYAVGMTA